ncbi:hypothetical protein WJX72_002087 [[Myrmecia] bisecta]|uniref:Thioesterase domain-containing protein n=1 Tax=[Myrmecia] bisecta TaxID=41462 RepID=A0AAW1QED5_9CHLO
MSAEYWRDPGSQTLIAVDPGEHRNTPALARKNQLAATVAGYRKQVLADGIPYRPDGLFPPNDPLLKELVTVGCIPFEKHLAGAISPYELLPGGGWTCGNAAARNGFDLRLFYKQKAAGAEYGVISGAARLGDLASIGNGFWMSAHGGAVESLLDEATAELGKLEFAPMLATVEANFKIRKPVPLHTSLRIECEIKSIKDPIRVSGAILLLGTAAQQRAVSGPEAASTGIPNAAIPTPGVGQADAPARVLQS